MIGAETRRGRGRKGLPRHAASAFHRLTRGLWLPGIPVLTYHSIDYEGGPESIGADLFAAQMRHLKENGFRSLSLSELLSATKTDPADKHLFCLTFDDGYRNVLTEGVPVLKEFGFRATVFVVADCCGQIPAWDWRWGSTGQPSMTEREIREVTQLGVEVGAHSCTHPFLTRIQPEEARREIRDSKVKLEQIVGKPVQDFAYPYGDWDERTRGLCVESGLARAFTTAQRKVRAGDDPRALPRVGINRMLIDGERLALDSLRACLSGSVSYYVAMRRLFRLKWLRR